jgi:tetratricopeptide (TPR) repeat protein
MCVRFFSCLFVLLLSAPLVSAQQPWLTEAERARFEELRRSGLDALYNIDYDKAQRDFKEIVKLYPNHPGGYQLLAARVWIKTLYESRRLQASLYSSESFYSTGDDKVDPKIVTEFRNYTREAKRLAEVKLKQEPKNIEALDFLANTEGLKAAFEEGVERRHFAALRDGNDAVNHHREVLKLDPKYIDAQITIGLYEYVVGSLPLPVKLLAGATGYRGSKKRGLKLLEQVAQEGTWAKDDAKSVLIVLYTREKRFAEKVKLSRELSEKFPAGNGGRACVAGGAGTNRERRRGSGAGGERGVCDFRRDAARSECPRGGGACARSDPFQVRRGAFDRGISRACGEGVSRGDQGGTC